MGTACSILLAEHPDQQVVLWSHDAAESRELVEARENIRFLPGIPLPDTIELTADIEQAAAGADYFVAAIPSKFLRSTLRRIAGSLRDGRPVISVIKGIENDTFLRPSQVIVDVLGDRPVAALGGPCHAEEAARRMPASVVVAGNDAALANDAQRMFNTERFRVYTNADIVGVELAAALKNVIAIAAGICDGRGFGDNAKSALITRGLVEITRFGVALGAEPLTFSGLAGMGDLITTCFSRHSRNRGVGERLGRGESLDAILRSMESVAEGITTARSVHEMAQQKGVQMPITAEIFAVLFEGKSPEKATNSLMERPPGAE